MYITKKEVAEALKISVATIDRGMKKGLPFYKAERSVRFKLEEVEKWLFEKSK